MKKKLLPLAIFGLIGYITPSAYGQEIVLNNFESATPQVTASYGAEYTNVANPVVDGNNPTENCGEIKRTTGNWYELIRFSASFNVPANTTKYIHLLARYTSVVIPNMSIRVDAAADNDGSADIHPTNSYITPGVWQDMVFEIPGGENGINPSQIVFFADATVNTLNNTNSFAYIDEIVINDNALPAGYQDNMILNNFEPGSPVVSASYGADYTNVANPLINSSNTTANSGLIKRTSGNWYEVVRFATYFNVPANTTKYMHILAKYTSVQTPNISVRIDAASDNDGSVDIHPMADYNNVGEWQDMVFEITGGDTGVSPSQILFFADAAVNALNNTDSFAYIDEILLNDDAISSTLNTPIAEQKNTLKVYPNPTANSWNFELYDISSVSSVQISDISGKIILSKNLDTKNTAIDASNLSNGIYFAKIIIGNEAQIVKLIKN